MVPISALMAAPTRPATMSPVRTGPSSLQRAIETTGPTAVLMFRALNWKKICAVKTAPVKIPVMITTACEPKPISTIW